MSTDAAARPTVGIDVLARVRELEPVFREHGDWSRRWRRRASSSSVLGARRFETLRRPENAGRAARTYANRVDTAALAAVATVPVIANGGLRTRVDALCRETQLGGAVCAAWPDDVRQRGHSGWTHRWQRMEVAS